MQHYVEFWNNYFSNTKNTVFNINFLGGYGYGFPATYSYDKDGSIVRFLLKSGCPEKELPFALKNLRAWENNTYNW